MGLRSWALRRLAGRFRIDDDIVRHLTTFQRLGEAVEVEMPTELLPVGARTVFRALRTRSAPQIGVDWVWPYWLHRQIDPESSAFVPRGHLPFPTNITARNWTGLGNVSSPWSAVVDPRGLVTPWYDGWSLDWWIGAEDRWHFPSREPAVRQRLVESTPVVETAMRIPGGDAVHRCYVIQRGDQELVVVEISNRSAVPVALAVAVRPYNPEGLAVVERIQQHGATIMVDGRPALSLPSVPRHATGSTFHDGDSARVVERGEAGTTLHSDLRCDAGLAQAAFLFPLPHHTTLRFAMPLRPDRRTRRRHAIARRLSSADTSRDLVSSDEVVKGWLAQTDRGMRVVLPAGRLAETVEANRCFMLLYHDGDEVTPGPLTYHRFWFRDAAYLLGAMDRWGFHAETAQVLATWPDRQRVDGYFLSQRQEWDSNGAALHALAEHWRLTGDPDALEGLDQVVARGVQWIERKRHSKRNRKDPEMEGLLPAGISAEHLGPFDFYYWDDFWGWKGMLDGAQLLEALGQSAAAAAVRQDAAAFGRDIEASLRRVAERLGTDAMPAGPRRRLDPGCIGSLAACWPLGLFPADHPSVVATADVIRERFCQGDAFYQGISHTGLGTYLTLQLAFVELESGDPRALRRLAWMTEASTSTATWPEAIHPQLGGGCMGDGHHGWAAADYLTFVRNLLVRDRPRGLDLLTLLPPDWFGHDLEVHDAPTHHGRLSYALRWHGERPALLWELTPHPAAPAGEVTLRAPGIDPGWSSTDRGGEALLAPPPPPEQAVTLG
ncbi:MAG TPA: hypothetical protein VGA13_12850 [Acidimicrobiales bacterium]